MLLLLLLPELNIASAKSATGYSSSLPVRVVDGPAPPPPTTIPLALLPPPPPPPRLSIESQLLRGTELHDGGWEAMSCAISATDGGGGIDGAVDDMWHMWLFRYVTSNVKGSSSSLWTSFFAGHWYNFWWVHL